ncbi:hypothetical protein, partial [Streptomyces sp. NPDC058418]
MGVEAEAVGSRSDAVKDAREPAEALPEEGSPGSGGYAPGAQVLVRDDLWLVRKCTLTEHDGWMVEVTGISPFVRGMDATFYDRLDAVQA